MSDARCKIVIDYKKLDLLDDGKSLLILGYRVELTDMEYGIIKVLLDSGRIMHKSEISALISIGVGSLPVHIANINKKALPITKRKLIEGNRRGEYRISENM